MLVFGKKSNVLEGMNIDHFIAKRVRDLRKARAFTREELAGSSGVSRSTISLIERKETRQTAERLQLSRKKPFRRRSLSSTRHAEYNSRGLDLCEKQSAPNAKF
jgi:transcriptional regulator with XRE-family HTH domain